MRSPVPQRPMSLDEYLAFEETSPFRHEYVAGQVHAMSGATLRHNLICGNVYAGLRTAAIDAGCHVFVEGVKLYLDDRTIYYPDVMVACGAQDESGVLARDPCLVVEVASPSTRATDHREKLAAYQRLASIRTYLIVEQDRREVHHHRRDAAGDWWHAVLTPEATAGRIALPCPGDGAVLTLDEIYAGVRWEERPRRVREGEESAEGW